MTASTSNTNNTGTTAGLTNIGATCYVNTAIQCLGFCSQFRNYILNRDNTRKETPIANELQKVYHDLWVNHTPVNTLNLLRVLHHFMHQCIVLTEQNDVAEFLLLFFDKLNADLAIKLTITPSDMNRIRMQSAQYQDKHLGQLAYHLNIHWINSVRQEYSPIMDLMYGQLVSQVICGHEPCNYIHHNYELYCGLALPLHERTNDTTTLDALLDKYFANETLSHWKCDQCNQKVNSKKSLKLWRNPPILMINLKRFNHVLAKNMCRVGVPLQLDISKYSLDSKSTNTVYRLVSICYHSGGFSSGHYIAVCRHTNDQWYVVDDETVRVANAEEVNHALHYGYVYFYEVCKS